MCVCLTSPESLCLLIHGMAEKHRDQTWRGELHKRHCGARTPCFHSAASKHWKTDLKEWKWEMKRRVDRQIVSVYVCELLRDTFFSWYTLLNLFFSLYSAAAWFSGWIWEFGQECKGYFCQCRITHVSGKCQSIMDSILGLKSISVDLIEWKKK